jgi:membrane dipeptidase
LRRPSITSRAFLLLGVALLLGAAQKQPAASPRAAHEAMLVLDTHLDTPAQLGRPGWSILDRHSADLDGDQVDLPRMVEGGLDGGWFVIFTPQGGRDEAAQRAQRDAALVRAVQIREMVAKHGRHFALALTADDAERIAAAGKRVVFMSMENGAPIETDIALVKSFRALGVTMMGPVHFRNNALADSATDKPEWNGLSAKGRQFVAEANRLGILLDGSHASDAATRQMMELSRAPIILSHSGMRAVHDHPRNVPDDLARAIAANGGVVQINAFSGYMVASPPNPARDAAMRELMAGVSNAAALSVTERRALNAKRRAIDARYPAPRATFDDVLKHVTYAIRTLGFDHVGISGDFDGGGGVEGFSDVTAFPKLTAALLQAGYSRADVAKVMGGNALRVLRAAQAQAEPGAVPTVPTIR